MFDALAAILEWVGIVTFSIAGALAASRKEMDIVGFIMLGTATGIGGGTIRDLLLGTFPVFWVADPTYLIVCVSVSCTTFLFAHVPQSRFRLLLWFDAIGVAVFAVIGAENALLLGVAPIVAIGMGVVTATFGGIIRDLLGGESPIIFRQEIYVTAALAGSALFVALSTYGTTREICLASSFLTGAAIRFAAMRWNWELPRYRPRPGRVDDIAP